MRQAPKEVSVVKVVCISDTHGMHRQLELPYGDVLVHAGDITMEGELNVVADFADWLDEQDHSHKVVVPGNHDFCFEPGSSRYDPQAEMLLLEKHVHVLRDRARTIAGIKFYGTPWVPGLPLWAFHAPDEYGYYRHIPSDVEVLVSHGPPYGLRDAVLRYPASSGGVRIQECLGSRALRQRISELKQLKLMVFGHIHDGYGANGARTTESGEEGPIIVNASSCDAFYRPDNKPIVVEL
jgi:Icc-related predicted phosphoesterase